MNEENLMLKFENGEGTNQKIDRIIDVVNWLCHEMQQGRVNNNKLVLQNDINLAEQRVTTPLSIAFVKMVEKGEIDEITASENANLFISWDEKSAYNANDLRQFNGKLYKCLQAHTAQADWSPDLATSLWKEIGVNENGVAEWSQPISALDAYMIGDVVMYNGVCYSSIIDNNVWSPEAYPGGWEVIENISSGDIENNY